VEDKLRRLGILAAADGPSPAMAKPDPLLALRFRKAIIAEHASYRVARLFKPLFFPPVVLAALVALVVFDVWLFGTHGVAQAFRQSLQSPGFILAHGHHLRRLARVRSRRGLAYPAFYTDVTDSYRAAGGGCAPIWPACTSTPCSSC
jgi:putative peptide zinc metalloprotease protein